MKKTLAILLLLAGCSSGKAAGMLTAEEAEEIALNHAGLARQEVMFDRTELDRDRNKTEYEVEFRAGRWEYSYEIDAVTGQILDYDKDYDD